MITHNKHLHVKLIKNAIIFPATGENISTKNSIQGVQSRHPEKDPEDFGLTYFGKNLTDYKIGWGYRLYPYFGGQAKAPHIMRFHIKTVT